MLSGAKRKIGLVSDLKGCHHMSKLWHATTAVMRKKRLLHRSEP
jgi:hypothetical protein